MPFGRIFGAIFFLVCAWLGLQFMSSPSVPANVAGGSLLVAGLSLALGLLTKRAWPRWVGMVAAIGLVGLGFELTRSGGSALDLVTLFAALATAVLLAVPATGSIRTDPDTPSPTASGFPGRLLATASIAGLIGLTASGVWAYRQEATADAESATPALPAMLAERVRWTDFGSALERARGEGRPVLVNFITTWCGYCKKMDQTTWKHPEVIERVQGMVPARVDLDDTRLRNGFKGNELGARYRISGTPATMLLDGEGQVLASAGGYQTPRQFLVWLEDAMAAVSAAGLQVEGP